MSCQGNTCETVAHLNRVIKGHRNNHTHLRAEIRDLKQENHTLRLANKTLGKALAAFHAEIGRLKGALHDMNQKNARLEQAYEWEHEHLVQIQQECQEMYAEKRAALESLGQIGDIVEACR